MMKRFYQIFAALFAALLVLTGCSTASSSPSDPPPLDMEANDPLPDSLKAEGYVDVGPMAGKWLEKGVDPEWNCKHYSHCTVAKMYAYEDCPNGVYAEVNFKNASGTIVGWTNDTLGPMSAGDFGVLVFRGDGLGTTSTLSELNCR